MSMLSRVAVAAREAYDKAEDVVLTAAIAESQRALVNELASRKNHVHTDKACLDIVMKGGRAIQYLISPMFTDAISIHEYRIKVIEEELLRYELDKLNEDQEVAPITPKF